MPPLTFLPGFGLVWRLIMFTPSTMRRVFPRSPGTTFRTRPRLPRSFPVMTSTLSFFRIGVARRDMSKDLGRERDDFHELALAQLAGDRAEYARADRFSLVVDQNGGVAIEADVGAVAPPLFLHRADDDRLDDLPLLDVRLGRGFLDRRRDDVAEPRVAAG